MYEKLIENHITEALNVNNNDFILIKDDCLKVMPNIEEGSVDLIATDLPYGTTQNKWDIIIPFEPMWASFKRVLKPNGVVVLTATQPFSSKLVISNLEWFKYEIIWEKSLGSGQLNIKHRPLSTHESVLVFYNKKPTYNEQKTKGEPYNINRSADYKDGNYGRQTPNKKINDGYRHAKSVVKISNPRIKGGHPTQKPVKLMEYIIKTYSNKKDTVLDCCMGSGTTGMACSYLDRNFIGIESDEDGLFFDKAVNQIKDTILFT